MVKYLLPFLAVFGVNSSCRNAESSTIATEVETGFDLKRILNMERRDMVSGEIMVHLYKKIGDNVNLNVLNPSEKVLFYIEEMEGQVYNGGFNQYYYNSSGEHADEVVEALLTVGAKNTAALVKEANAQFPGGVVPKDRSTRGLILRAIEDRAESRWSELESVYYGTSEAESERVLEDLTELLYNFILENSKDFE